MMITASASAAPQGVNGAARQMQAELVVELRIAFLGGVDRDVASAQPGIELLTLGVAEALRRVKDEQQGGRRRKGVVAFDRPGGVAERLGIESERGGAVARVARRAVLR